MVFSSVPVFLDPPNWHHLQQQPNLEQENVAGNNHPQHQLPPLPPPPYGGGGGGSGGTGGSIKPGSMSDRARLAKIPQPETALKCPRCESTNTKFCYFNNYSLSQPRHFCKTCRRYWTRGGALRNVPVGGGCRRNKKSRTKNTNTNTNTSSSTTKSQTTTTTTSSSILAPPPAHHMLMGHHNNFPQQPLQLPFLSSLQNLTQFGINQMDSILTADRQWPTNIMHQLPFLDSGNNQMFGFHNGEPLMMTASSTGARVSDQVVKAEEKQPTKTFMGISENNNNNNVDGYYAWGGGGGNIWSHENATTEDHDQLSPGQQLINSSAAPTTHFL